MTKTKKLIIIFIIIISVALIVGTTLYLLDTTGKINQGNFRVNDAMIVSTIDVKEDEIQEGNAQITKISDIPFTLTQKNMLSIYISKDVEISKIYLDKISVEGPKNKGNIIFSSSIDQKIELNNIPEEIEIKPMEKDEQYFVEFKIDNVDFIKSAKVLEGTKELKYDGTILKALNIDIKDIIFNIKFNLNIVDITGKVNTCEVNLKLPDEKLILEGISVIKQENSDYIFSVK